ncbi:rhodanese-like domain-containing protein [Rhodohalobacter sp. SW132]|uniref:rhodanese-like domain-containing protein n=1 Tax=Rhodohalobacter sp. SW132 TaxID=2293433 RepID=UPI000E2284D2|nr:rhodanese-like domain-containing protein [Rhodohalobacter sp. SW132]REL38412.1 rhodanese-like domain-containing protein [Rhodohalobacter sp. SW132]
MQETTVVELKKRQDSGDSFTLLDVREHHEVHISKIENSTLIPLDDLPSQLDELDKNQEIVVMCRSGARSAKACTLLMENGFDQVSNLKGGINEWSKKIDPSLPVY